MKKNTKTSSGRFSASRNISDLSTSPRSSAISRSASGRGSSSRSFSSSSSGGSAPEPELARRRQHRKSTIKSGRTIGQQREKLETASERQAAHKKALKKSRRRIIFVTFTFILAAICVAILYFLFFEHHENPLLPTETAKTYAPTVQIIDESSATAGISGTEISTRMKNYVGQAEVDFKDLGYTVDKVVLPNGSIRELDFYLKGQPGYIKFHLDRPTAESVEDADRLIRYLAAQGTSTFEYLDVRLPNKAYWK